MSELKACPFCGSASAPIVLTVAETEMLDMDREEYEWALMHWATVCNFNSGGCGASTGYCYESADAAAAAWNRRAKENG